VTKWLQLWLWLIWLFKSVDCFLSKLHYLGESREGLQNRVGTPDKRARGEYAGWIYQRRPFNTVELIYRNLSSDLTLYMSVSSLAIQIFGFSKFDQSNSHKKSEEFLKQDP
jgi:hypothetical protein